MPSKNENQFAVRASRKNRLVVLAGLLAFILIANGVIGLFALSYSNENHLADLQNIGQLARALGTARAAQVHLKKQVQEWKNILLRGADPAEFTRYRAAFDEEERQVQKELRELSELLQKTQVATAQVEEVRKSHELLGVQYRNALQEYRSETSSSALAVDKKVRGIDRAPTDEMDAIVDQIQRQAGELSIKIAEDTNSRYQTLRHILIAGTSAGVIVVLIFLGLSFAALPKE